MGKEVGKKQTKKRRQPFVTVQRSLSSFAALAACHLLQLRRLEPRQTLFPPPLFFLLTNSGRCHSTSFAHSIFRDLTADVSSVGAWVSFVWA